MLDINKIVINGNLIDDPKTVTVRDKKITAFRIARTDLAGNSHYYTVESWDKLAEKCMEFKKGAPVIVTAKMEQDQWEKDGKSKTATKLNAIDVQPGVVKLDLNDGTINGNLVKDPEIKKIGNDKTVTIFRIGRTNRAGKGHFFNVEVWNGLGKTCAEHLKKGSGVVIEFRLEQNRWEDSDGQKQSIVKLNAKDVHFLPGKLFD